MKVEFGRLAILKVEEIETPEGAEAVSRYLLFDANTKRPVYWAPLTDEGLETVKNVRAVKEKERSERGREERPARSSESRS